MLQAEIMPIDALRGDGGDAAQPRVEAGLAPDAAPHHFVADQGVIGRDTYHRAGFGQIRIDHCTEFAGMLREVSGCFHGVFLLRVFS